MLQGYAPGRGECGIKGPELNVASAWWSKTSTDKNRVARTNRGTKGIRGTGWTEQFGDRSHGRDFGYF